MWTGFQRCAFGIVAAGVIAAPLIAFAGSAAPKGDPAAGKVLYVECEGCHALQENRVGPKHCGVVGRKVAAVPDYPSYSEAMRSSGLVWDPKTLDEFLTEPFSYVSGTTMGYAGLTEDQQRADLIAYLDQAGKDPAVCGAE